MSFLVPSRNTCSRQLTDSMVTPIELLVISLPPPQPITKQRSKIHGTGTPSVKSWWWINWGSLLPDELRRTMILMTYILWYLFNLPFLKLTSSPLKITGIGRWTFPLRGGKNSAYFSEAYPYEVFNGGCYHHSIKTGSQKSQKSTRIANLTWCQHGKIGTRQSMKLFDKLQQHRPVVNPRR